MGSINTSSGDFAAQAKLVLGLASVVPAGASPAYVNTELYERVTVIINVKNATTVTGAAITLLQATDVNGAGEKAVSFATAKRNLDADAADSLSDFAVVSDTFTTDSTDSKNLMYVMDVDPANLDSAGGFQFLRAGVGNATAAEVEVLYILWASKAPPYLPSAKVAN
jgi:hypothetical protein